MSLCNKKFRNSINVYAKHVPYIPIATFYRPSFCIITRLQHLRLSLPPPRLKKNLGLPFTLHLVSILKVNFKRFGLLHRCYYRKALRCHLSIVCTIYVQGGKNVCCPRQFLKKIHGILSLRVPIFVLFYP